MTPEQQEMADNIAAEQARQEAERRAQRKPPRPDPFRHLRTAFEGIGTSAADAAAAFRRMGDMLADLARRDAEICELHRARARWHARQAVRPCCRSHGTTCPRCREWDYRMPQWLVRLRDRFDAWRAV